MPTYHQPGPSDLPESVQGATLWQSLVRSVPRLLPVADLLHAAASAVKGLEVQLGESIEREQREQERAMAAEMDLDLAHVLIAELVAALGETPTADGFPLREWLESRPKSDLARLIAKAEAAILPPGLRGGQQSLTR